MDIPFSVVLVVIFLLLLFSKGFSYSIPQNVVSLVNHPKKNSTCKMIVSAKGCRPCTSHEQKFLKICKETGNVEEIICGNPKSKMTESCPFAFKAEMNKFIIFEVCCGVLAIVSNAVVWWRRKALDQVKYQRLKRQISDVF
eukprot:TCONS_00012022-protein